jgi:hypothetical protein
VREKNHWVNTPLHLAALSGKTDTMWLLVESWPEGMEALNEDGQTPLSAFERYETGEAFLVRTASDSKLQREL